MTRKVLRTLFFAVGVLLYSFGPPGYCNRAVAFSPKLPATTFTTTAAGRKHDIQIGQRLGATSIHSSSVVATPDLVVDALRPNVQRKYETFRWFYNETNAEYNINYRVEGTGTPILLIHGFGANVNHFRFQFPALVEQGYRVYAVDLLGFGASDKPGTPEYSIELFVQLLTDFILHNNSKGEKWFVAGNSIGGLCSLGIADRLPEVVAGVILFNCAGGMTGFRYEDVPIYIRPILYFVQKVLLGPQFGGRFFANFKTRENVEAILKSNGVYRNTTNVDDMLLEILLGPSEDEGAETVFLKTFAGPPGPTPESILPRLDCPVLAIWGGDDPWTPVDGGMHPGTEFHKFAKDFELVVLDGVGHCPHDEAPDQVHSSMLPWMKSVSEKLKLQNL